MPPVIGPTFGEKLLKVLGVPTSWRVVRIAVVVEPDAAVRVHVERLLDGTEADPLVKLLEEAKPDVIVEKASGS